MPVIQDLNTSLQAIADERARLIANFKNALSDYEQRYLGHDAKSNLMPKGRTQLNRLLAYQAIQAVLNQDPVSFEAIDVVLTEQIKNIGLNDKKHYRKGLQAAAQSFLDGQVALRNNKIAPLLNQVCLDNEALTEALNNPAFYNLLSDADLGLILSSPQKNILLEHFVSITDVLQLNRKIPHVMDPSAIMIDWDKSKTIDEHIQDFKLATESKKEEQGIKIKDDSSPSNTPKANLLKKDMQVALKALKQNLERYPKQAVRSIFKGPHTRQEEIGSLNKKIDEWEKVILAESDEVKLKAIQRDIAEVLMEKLEVGKNWQGRYSHDALSLHQLVRGPLVALLGIGQYQDAWLPWADELNEIIKNQIEKLPQGLQLRS